MSAAARESERMTAEKVAAVLRAFKFHYAREKELQDGIALAFEKSGVPFEREVKIGTEGEIIDFLVSGAIGVEVKIKGSPSAVARQLLGYARCLEIREIILLTGRARLGRLPPIISGKPLHVVALWSTFL